MSITWIFTIISLFFCCVAAYNLKKIQKNNKSLREIKVDEIKRELRNELLEDCVDVAKNVISANENKAKYTAIDVVRDAVRQALAAVNISKTEGYMITSLSYNPKAYAIWRKCNLSKPVIAYSELNGMFYTLIKLFDSDNAEENLRNATELCKMLSDGINETM